MTDNQWHPYGTQAMWTTCAITGLKFSTIPLFKSLGNHKFKCLLVFSLPPYSNNKLGLYAQIFYSFFSSSIYLNFNFFWHGVRFFVNILNLFLHGIVIGTGKPFFSTHFQVSPLCILWIFKKEKGNQKMKTDK
jgi:hypothetical protein